MLASSKARPRPVPSRLQFPERRKQVAARLPLKLVAKLEAVVRLWKAQAAAEGKSEEAISDLNQTWVIEVLLGDALDVELQQFGGMPVDEDGWKAVEKSIKLSNKQ